MCDCRKTVICVSLQKNYNMWCTAAKLYYVCHCGKTALFVSLRQYCHVGVTAVKFHLCVTATIMSFVGHFRKTDMCVSLRHKYSLCVTVKFSVCHSGWCQLSLGVNRAELLSWCHWVKTDIFLSLRQNRNLCVTEAKLSYVSYCIITVVAL